MSPIKISASILSADFGRLAAHAQEALDAGVDLLHMDVMDGHFVPNISFGAPVIAALKGRLRRRDGSPAPFDTHLMIADPSRYAEDFVKAGSTYLLFHAEAVKDPMALISRIRSMGARPGLVVNPDTSEEALRPHAGLLDYVLFMTVVPGFSGQSFMPGVLPKIERYAAWARSQGLKGEIAVDGGVNPGNARSLVDAGATLLVAATAIFKAPDLAAAVAALKDPR